MIRGAVLCYPTRICNPSSVDSLITGRMTEPDHTAPYGADSFMNIFHAVNCQATIIQSLRDKVRSADREDAIPPSFTALTTMSAFPSTLPPPGTATTLSES